VTLVKVLKVCVELKTSHIFRLQFVTHPSVQQLLASIWYEGLPGFRCKSMLFQFLEIVRIAVSFPFWSLMYIIVPSSSYGQKLKKPFIKFICHSASYVTFLGKVEYSVELTYICIYVYSLELKISKPGCRMCNKW
jgi:hypothetical protein